MALINTDALNIVLDKMNKAYISVHTGYASETEANNYLIGYIDACTDRGCFDQKTRAQLRELVNHIF